MLAETVQIDGGVLLVVLAILAAIAALALATVVLGFVWAARSARGSRQATRGWAAVLVLELAAFLASGLDTENGAFWVPLLAAGGQLVTYSVMRWGRSD